MVMRRIAGGGGSGEAGSVIGPGRGHRLVGCIPAMPGGMTAAGGGASVDCCNMITGAPPADGVTAAGAGAYGCPSWGAAAAGNAPGAAIARPQNPRTNRDRTRIAGTPFPGSRPAPGAILSPRGPESFEPKS